MDTKNEPDIPYVEALLLRLVMAVKVSRTLVESRDPIGRTREKRLILDKDAEPISHITSSI